MTPDQPYMENVIACFFSRDFILSFLQFSIIRNNRFFSFIFFLLFFLYFSFPPSESAMRGLPG